MFTVETLRKPDFKKIGRYSYNEGIEPLLSHCHSEAEFEENRFLLAAYIAFVNQPRRSVALISSPKRAVVAVVSSILIIWLVLEKQQDTPPDHYINQSIICIRSVESNKLSSWLVQ